MDQDEHNAIIQKRFSQLPEAVQRAVTDASVEKKLRALAQKHKLHLDQWVLLENEIMLTLLGLEDPANMVDSVAKEVGVKRTVAQEIVNDIAREVFNPIRETLQHALAQEGRKRESVPIGTGAETTSPLEKAKAEKTAPSDTSNYRTGESSFERRDVQDDPYRESIE